MLSVAIISNDPSSIGHLVAALEQTGVVGSVKQWMLSGTKVPDAADAVPDVIFLDLGRDPAPFFTLGAHLRRIRSTSRLLALSAVSPPTHQLLLEAMRAGVQDLLPKPVDAELLKEKLSGFAKEFDAQARPSLDRLMVVMGSKGGVGTTTVGVNLGVQLSVFAHRRVVLLDFARPLGNAHLLLDLHPKFGIRDAVDGLERLDSHFFAGLLTPHETKLQLLAGASQPEEWQAVRVSSLERIVNVAQSGFEMVLLDMGSQFSAEWSSILKTARMIFIITEANVPSLWTLQRRLVALSGLGVEAERVRIIINRWHKGDDEVLRGIQKDIGRPVFACIPNDFRKASTSVNLGTPLLETSSNNGLSIRYREIAAQISGTDPGPAGKRAVLGGFFSFSNKR
jgi:pilus assembly protein CpaE